MEVNEPEGVDVNTRCHHVPDPFCINRASCSSILSLEPQDSTCGCVTVGGTSLEFI